MILDDPSPLPDIPADRQLDASLSAIDPNRPTGSGADSHLDMGRPTAKPLFPAAAAKAETHEELIHDLRAVEPETHTPTSGEVLPANHSDLSNSPTPIFSVQPSPVSSAHFTDVQVLIGDTSEMLHSVISDSLGKLCAFGECCKNSSKDGCEVQMECVGQSVQLPAAATRASALDSLADAAIACEGDQALVAAARQKASDATRALPTAVCAASTCKQLHQCVVDVSSQAVMALLISRSEHNSSVALGEFDADLRSCAMFDSSAMTAIRPGSVRALWSRHGSAQAPDQLGAHKHPQLAPAIGVVTLFIIGTIVFSVAYRIERSRKRSAGHFLHKKMDHEAVHVW
jgi:hypothetical protein